MSSTKENLIAAGWVAGIAVCVLLGSGARDRIDLAGSSESEGKTQGLLASRDRRGGTEIPAGDFFYELTEKLKKEYVEPIKDEQKLASGAVRGMIGYLGDPKSIFMDKDEFRVFLNARQGKYEGIGADLALLTPTPGAKADRSVLQPTPSEEGAPATPIAPTKKTAAVPQLPRLTVVSVVPGGPADRAGVKVGDVVDTVDAHWVVSGGLIAKFTKAVDDFKAKKISLPELNAVRKEFKAKYDRRLLPLRARDRLTIGKTGLLKIGWERNGNSFVTEIIRGESQRPGFGVEKGAIRLPLVQGAAGQLKAAMQGKSAVTLDLRNNVVGDFATMRQCLAVLAPSGSYGSFVTDRAEKGTPLTVSNGNANPPKITLLTDRTTRGAAEILALALSSRGLAKLSGQETGGDRDIYEISALPDGSGYTLVTGHYKPDLVNTRVADKGDKE